MSTTDKYINEDETKTEEKPSVSDLLFYGATQKPYEFEQAFNAIMQDKVRDRIEHARISVATNMFNKSEE